MRALVERRLPQEAVAARAFLGEDAEEHVPMCITMSSIMTYLMCIERLPPPALVAVRWLPCTLLSLSIEWHSN